MLFSKQWVSNRCHIINEVIWMAVGLHLGVPTREPHHIYVHAAQMWTPWEPMAHPAEEVLDDWHETSSQTTWPIARAWSCTRPICQWTCLDKFDPMTNGQTDWHHPMAKRSMPAVVCTSPSNAAMQFVLRSPFVIFAANIQFNRQLFRNIKI